MLEVAFAQQKIQAILSQVSELQAADFPYQEPTSALAALDSVFRRDFDRLSRLDASADRAVRHQSCAQANANIALYHLVLGFLLRATSPRNAFELYDPLLRLSKKLCGSHAKLVLSSEWSFSPFTYPPNIFPDLPDLIFIGMPASEADNALIVPLAGHELGHSVWRMVQTAPKVSTPIVQRLIAELEQRFTTNWTEFSSLFALKTKPESLVSDLLVRGIWTRSYKLASRQIEETFCDVLGLRIFGEGFLYSFGYAISPNLGDRTVSYPPLPARVGTLKKAAVKFGTAVPDGFGDWFSESSPNLSNSESFLLRMADEASATLVDELIAKADEHVKSAGVALPDQEHSKRIVRQFEQLAPASAATSLADIINAGWQMYLNPDKWQRYNLDQVASTKALNDLVLKSIEVMEFNIRLKGPENA